MLLIITVQVGPDFPRRLRLLFQSRPQNGKIQQGDFSVGDDIEPAVVVVLPLGEAEVIGKQKEVGQPLPCRLGA